MTLHQAKSKPQWIFFPPDIVDIKDIQSNGFLLPDNDLVKIKLFVEDLLKKQNVEKKVSKKEMFSDNFKDKYSIIIAKHPEGGIKTYIVYKGAAANKILGAGTSGIVKVAQDIETGEWVAIKNIKIKEKEKRSEKKGEGKIAEEELADLKAAQADRFEFDSFVMNETEIADEPKKEVLEINRTLETKEYDILIKLKSARGKLERKSPTKNEQTCIIMDLGPRITLRKLLEQQQLTAQEALIIIDKILKIMSIFNKERILHRDIKPDNILIDLKTMTVKLIDFGDVAILPENTENISDVLHGTRQFVKPFIDVSLELVEQKMIRESEAQMRYSHKSDMYSVGKVIEFILAHVKNTDENKLLLSIKNDIHIFLKDNAYINFLIQHIAENPDLLTALINADKIIDKDIPSADEMLTKYFSDLTLEADKKNIGLVNCKQLLDEPATVLQEIATQLKKYNEVVFFIDKTTIPFEKFIEIKHNLEKFGIRVHPKLLITTDPNLSIQWFRNEAAKNNINNHYTLENLGLRIARQKAALFHKEAQKPDKLEKIDTGLGNVFFDRKKVFSQKSSQQTEKPKNPAKQESYGVKDKIDLFQTKINTYKHKK